jgi:hypothetical protein
MLVFLKKTETFKKIHKIHEILSLLLQTSLLVIPSKTNISPAVLVIYIEAICLILYHQMRIS